MSTACKIASADATQFNPFDGMPAAADGPALCASTAGARKFVAGDPHAIFIGTTRLEEYLKQAGQREPFIVAYKSSVRPRIGPANGGWWWSMVDSRFALNKVLTVSYFDSLGIPKLT
jgi:hypothetical protein